MCPRGKMGISEWLAIPELFRIAKTESRVTNPILVKLT